MRHRMLSTVALIATAIVSASCSTTDSPVAPQVKEAAPTVGPSKSLLGTLLGSPQTVTPLLRTKPLASAITVSRRIGILGGVIPVPGAGLTIVVPPLAVSSMTNFSVTALAGSAVAYQFEPHGTKFTLPLVATQDLHGTQAQTGLVNPLSLFVGYFPDSSNVTSVTELLNLGVSLPTLMSVFTIWHFSGYILASGRSDSGDDF
jgi:hypothetical protein